MCPSAPAPDAVVRRADERLSFFNGATDGAVAFADGGFHRRLHAGEREGEFMREIGQDELKRNNGKNGNPAYVAHRGNVYDVTGSDKWKGGAHMVRHHAGGDLTAEIGAAPHGIDVLERYPKVGVLKNEETGGEPLPPIVSRILERYPMLRRHPHPMTVHFPIVLMFFVPVFTLLRLCTGAASFESTALHCLGAGLLFTPAAMMTGYITWWLNYEAKPSRPVLIKQRLSWLLLTVAAGAFVWRMAVPDILVPFGWAGAVYLLLLLSFIPLVSTIGWFGGRLTFPVEGE